MGERWGEQEMGREAEQELVCKVKKKVLNQKIKIKKNRIKKTQRQTETKKRERESKTDR